MSIDKIAEILKAAAKIVDEADLPADLRATAFQEAVELLRDKSPTPSKAQSQSGPVASDSSEAWASRIAQRLRLNVEAVSEMFEFEDGAIRLLVAPSRLPQSRAAGMREISLLIAGARQAAGVDEGWTPTAVIRDVCRDFGVFDQANFAGEITSMDVFAFKGSGASRQIKVTARGFEQLGDRIRQLASSA